MIDTCYGGFATGYFSNAEATSSTLDSEGWLRTGDLCYIDDDGFIFVVDRLKELIKYKGYQVNEVPLTVFLQISLTRRFEDAFYKNVNIYKFCINMAGAPS